MPRLNSTEEEGMLFYSEADRELWVSLTQNVAIKVLKHLMLFVITFGSLLNTNMKNIGKTSPLTTLHKTQTTNTNRMRHSPLWCPTALYFTALPHHCTALHWTLLVVPLQFVLLYCNIFSVHRTLLYIWELLRTAFSPYFPFL